MDMLLGQKIHLCSMSSTKVPTETCAVLAVLATTQCNCVNIVVRLPCIKSSSHSTKLEHQPLADGLLLSSFDLQEQLLCVYEKRMHCTGQCTL